MSGQEADSAGKVCYNCGQVCSTSQRKTNSACYREDTSLVIASMSDASTARCARRFWKREPSLVVASTAERLVISPQIARCHQETWPVISVDW
jgi:hypothetical protein